MKRAGFGPFDGHQTDRDGLRDGSGVDKSRAMTSDPTTLLHFGLIRDSI
jgi:hypothetical protein